MTAADGVIVLDKPSGITSFQAVERVGRVFRKKKCGHAGTLDPIATGVLPVCVGRATKIAGYLAMQEKEYEVFFRFGVETDTGDSAGRQTGASPGGIATEGAVRAAIAALGPTGLFGDQSWRKTGLRPCAPGKKRRTRRKESARV